MTSVPAGHTIIGSRGVFKVKADNSHKRRIFVLGWGQSPGIGCGRRFFPVCMLQSNRKVLAIPVECNIECWEVDWNTRFLHADVTEGVYVKMAPRYEEFDENGVSLVMRVLKSFCGLRQSSTNWWKTIDEHLEKIGLKVSSRTPASTPTRRMAPFFSDSVRRRCSTDQKRPSGAKAEQAETDESIIGNGHGRCVTRVRSGCYP